MAYGMLASKSCLRTDIVDQLHENSQKANSVERLTGHLNKGVPAETVIHIDNSDVVKPASYKFESLSLVRGGSRSTDAGNVYEKGYHVTEACVLTADNHPISIFSETHASKYVLKEM